MANPAKYTSFKSRLTRYKNAQNYPAIIALWQEFSAYYSAPDTPPWPDRWNDWHRAAELRKFLDTTSILGGQLIEGMVIKPIKYDLYGVDKKVLLGKFVSEKFKEIHSKVWGENNPTRKDIVDRLIEGLRTPARWNKSIQHLRDDGKLTDSPRDIGMLIKAIQHDIDGDAKEIVAQQLLKHFWPQIMRATTAGFPEYYKQLLLDKQFDSPDTGDVV